jgi:ATP-dependent Zn protease
MPTNAHDSHTAYHEAGHAVVAHVLGERIELVTLEAVEHPQGTKHGLTRNWVTGQRTEILEKKLQIRQAGRLATLKAFGTSNGGSYDLRACRQAFKDHGGSWPEAQVQTHMARSSACALIILELHWRAVEALANALISQRILSGDEAHSIIQTAIDTAQLAD